MNDDNMMMGDDQSTDQDMPTSMAMNQHAVEGQVAAANMNDDQTPEDSTAAADQATMVDLDSMGDGASMQDLAEQAAELGSMGAAQAAVDSLEQAVAADDADQTETPIEL